MKILSIIAVMALSAGVVACAKTPEKNVKATMNTEINNNNKGENKMKVTELTAEMFKQKIMNYEKNPQSWTFEGNKPAIIDFYATWCGPCKATAPVLEELAKEYDGKIDIYKVDIDQQQELASMFGIRSVPSLLFIPKTGEPQMAVGALGKADFKKAIGEIMGL